MERKYIDLQVNGFVGVDFSTLELDYDSFMKAADAVFKSGTEIFLPTLVTSDLPLYERNIAIIRNAAEKNGLMREIPGVHLEGPFISNQPGAVGCHNPDFVRDCDSEWLLDMLERTGNYVKMITIAAELNGAADFTRCATDKGVVVSLGHHLAKFEDVRKCAAAGAKTLTHLANGCPNMMNRHDNPVWAGLACDDLTAMLITDGHHLPGEIIRCMAKIKGADKIIVTRGAEQLERHFNACITGNFSHEFFKILVGLSQIRISKITAQIYNFSFPAGKLSSKRLFFVSGKHVFRYCSGIFKRREPLLAL